MGNEGATLLKETEAAAFLNVSTHFLRRDRISEKSVGIPFVKIGAAVRYRLADLDEWVSNNIRVSAELAVTASKREVPAGDINFQKTNKSTKLIEEVPKSWLPYLANSNKDRK